MKFQLINSIRTNNFNDEHMMEKIRTIWKGASVFGPISELCLWCLLSI